MIHLQTTGSIFDFTSPSVPTAIVNTVNCVGVMGKGLALEFKQRYPAMFKVYAAECKAGRICVGQVSIWSEGNNLFIVNFPTKDDWRNPSQLKWIADGLDDLRERAIMMNMQSLILPALGCNLGGLNFDDVRLLIEQKLGDLEANVILFGPK
jgi:O-acetyl-ADP-ribose deacetylase (regulator of RNase III)